VDETPCEMRQDLRTYSQQAGKLKRRTQDPLPDGSLRKKMCFESGNNSAPVSP